jgi:RNA polymerase sigma-70 factor (ECF subfamily)
MIENPAESLSPEALARTYLRRVYGFCRSMLRNERDAEDACQEVFLTVMRRWDQLGTVRRPQAWLMKVARLTCLWVRRKRRNEVAIEEAAVDAPCDPGPPIEIGTERGRIQQALERLPERYQSVLTMHYQQGMSQEEIAEAMDLSRGALRVLLHRAVMRLRQEVKQ